MFGLFKAPANEPLELEVAAAIEASAEKIFELLDFSSPRSRLKLRGFEFTQSANGMGDYAAVDPNMPGVIFHFSVLEYQPPGKLTYRCWLESDEPIGALEHEESEVLITERGDGTCHVEIKTISSFRDGLSGRERRGEDAKMTQAVGDNLMRLKMEAEGSGASPNV